MNSRRHFIKTTSFASAMLMWQERSASLRHLFRPSENGVYWQAVRDQFPITTWDKIHFNSGSAGVMPTMVEDHLIALSKSMNRMAPYEAWGTWQEELGNIKTRLATLINTDEDRLSLVRNTTEGLNMLSTGLQLKTGDEVLMADHDYPYADHTWLNRGHKSEVVIKKISMTLPTSDEEVVASYRSNITSRTRVIHITHMTHREGHIMPVKALIDLAKEHGLISIVDGAHVVGQLPLDIKSLDPDGYVSSLHKWLNTPHGNGLLYVNPEILSQMHTYPSAPVADGTSSAQFTHLGTRAFHIEIGIGAALDFHDALGATVKYDRLQKLKHYWTDQLQDEAKVKWHTNLEDEKSCGVVTFSIDGISGGQVLQKLDSDYNIHAKSVGISEGSGVRISPNIFTNTQELDKLVAAIRDIART